MITTILISIAAGGLGYLYGRSHGWTAHYNYAESERVRQSKMFARPSGDCITDRRLNQLQTEKPERQYVCALCEGQKGINGEICPSCHGSGFVGLSYNPCNAS